MARGKNCEGAKNATEVRLKLKTFPEARTKVSSESFQMRK